LDRVAGPLRRFLAVESASGIVLLACTLVALVLANSPARDAWHAFWQRPFTIGLGDAALSYPLWYWVNDGLMAVFFFVIGLEIKRELVLGELAEPKKVLLPVAAAIGGALLPALIFLGLRHGTPDARGWAVPMATDIAFVVGCLALLGPRVPHGLKILLLTLAIVDDLLAVIVIAAFYSGALDAAWLAGAAGGLAAIVALNRGGVRQVGVYVLAGAFVWLCTLKSGIHPTVAGAALGLLTPWRAWVDDALTRDVLAQAASAIRDDTAPLSASQRQALLAKVSTATREALSPLDRLQHALHGWVGFVIMPIFALANAGVALGEGSALAPLPLAVALGLVLGKPLGILGASWLATRAGGRLPDGVTWRVMLGSACLAGIGFTMSLFVASLSFDGAALASAKTGVLLGSLVAGTAGLLLLRLTLRAPPR
jgi:NhaA family Na+:H+ antiporter